MSAARFTPGPWRVEEGTTLIWGACNPDDMTSYGMGVPICEARHWQSAGWERQRHPMTDEEIDANARLIAAAPELYEALLHARLMLEAHALRRGETFRDGAIDNALAKAVQQ